MIAKLKGLVDSTGEDWAIIDVGGVGYLVSCSGRTIGKLPKGQAAMLHIETHVREDAISLYGFADMAEREWFRLLTTVQGVGAKVALAILGTLSPDELARSIGAQDKAMLTRANGVGPKLALRIVTELKEKAGKIALGPALEGGIAAAPAAGTAPVEAVATEGGAMADAISALVNLGYRRVDAFGAVAQAAQSLGEGADVAALIRAGLKELGNKEQAR